MSVVVKSTRILLASMVVVSACSAADPAPTTITAPAATTAPRSSPALKVDAWENLVLSTLCIETTEQYDGIANRTPIKEQLTDAFRDDDVGVTVVESGCDAVLTIAATGRPLSAVYTGNRLYTGATVSGTVMLSADGMISLEAPFSGRKDPPDRVTYVDAEDLPRDPHDAPLWEIAKDGICVAFTEWFEGSPTRLIQLVRNLRTTTKGCGEWIEPVVIPFLDN